MNRFKDFSKSLRAADNYVYALCEIQGNKRVPFYIGRGINTRCLDHLKNKDEPKKDEKSQKIQRLLREKRLGIDILRHGMKSVNTTKAVESTCIDLLGVGELLNKVRGSGSDMGRLPIEELHNLMSGEVVEVAEEHKGLAFLLNDSFKSGMSEYALYEATRGVWWSVPREKDLKYAYATHGGLVKEVYEINSWVPAGTQNYYTRELDGDDFKNRWEFVGRKANKEIRDLYVGKVIDKSVVMERHLSK